GTVLQNRYRILDVLGVGGMSTVYRARDLRFTAVERLCAVKEMFNSTEDPRLRQLRLTTFHREAALLATLTHSAIPRIYDYFEQQGTIYLVMELILGSDLETMLSQRGEPFDEATIIDWTLELCSVLSYLHGQKPEPVIFRDIKPSNIMIRNDGSLVLVDFGIARPFAPDQKGTMIGTEGYAPPEQYRGIADARGDIYALGATLHHLATGSDPRTETPFTFAQRPPRRLNQRLSPEFEQIILKCVQYSPADRYQSADEVRDALLELKNKPSRVARAEAVAAPLRERTAGSRLLSTGNFGRSGSVEEASQRERIDWVVRTGDEVRSSAAHAGGAVYVGSYDGYLYAIDETDGTVRWRFRAQRGIVSRPLPTADAVIFGSEDRTVYAISRQHGREVWSFRTNMAVRSSAVSDDRACFIGSDDGCVYRLERARGAVGWRYRTWGPVRSTPVLAGPAVLFGSDDGYLYAVHRESGSLCWRVHFGAPIQSSPAVEAGIIVVGAADGTVRAVAEADGKLLWSYQTGKAVIASPTIVDATVYIGSADGAEYALDLHSGSLNWKTSLCRQVTGSSTADGEVLYVPGVDGVVYCLNRADGNVKWSCGVGGPLVTKPLVTADHVIVGSIDGNIYALHRHAH
ncbi:MAG: protein kinase, partial [Chloroflexota bacterium]